MIKQGANVNLCDHNDTTAVHIATVSGRADNLRVLLENGADANASNNTNETAIEYAIKGVRRQDDMHDYLLCAKLLLN
jgi:ankyrin repeat protein